MRSVLYIAAAAAAKQPPLWPLPQNYSCSTQKLTVIPSPAFFRVDAGSDVLAAAAKRYIPLAFPHGWGSPGVGLPALSVVVDDGVGATERAARRPRRADDAGALYPSLTDDESYKLRITATSATLKARTVWGALRGLETFSQLVTYGFDSATYEVVPCTIQDAPKYPHRGLMVDSGRHFLPVATLLHVVDALPYAKLNVLHWHLTDTQSFPVETPSRPMLWKGAFSKRERYSVEDVRLVVERARLRGIRVIPEFDTPGHAESWCDGYPSVCPSPTCKTPLDVSKAETFAALDDVLGDASKLFPDAFVHLGGDEVDTSCWGSTPSIQLWLQERNYTTADAYAYFVSRAAKLARAHGKRPIQWAEVFDQFGATLDKSTVVHVWKPSTNITEVVQSGYDCLVNVGYVTNSWYLDNLDSTWDRAYGVDLRASVPLQLRSKVLGGHGEMWGRARRVVFDGTDERRGSRCPRRRDGGRLGFRRNGLAAPRRDR
jgi:hexosaminidase